MTIPIRPGRRPRDDQRFDLRATALFFLLLAVVLCLLGFVVRTAAAAVEHRPSWVGALVMLGVAVALLSRSRWRRWSAARGARRAARALEEAAVEAAGSLDGGARDAVGPGAPGSGLPAEASAGAVRREAVPGPEATVPVAAGPDEEVVGRPVVPGLLSDHAELDPDGFEQAVAELCVRDDCRSVEVVGGAGDLGADVIAHTADGLRVVIQCKLYGEAHKVGSQDMQRFGGTCFTIHEADVAALVTTSDFTAPALEYADECGIVCVDGQDLEAWRQGTGPSPWQRARTEP
ncbi:restriction endonuclease [Streptomyces misionensis]|uniref:Restriction endonuclease n=1 Tax=Streptomyces misionensis TaxID=67331 RepID=A0A5C6INF6_9ACTN|nr:restriction endonuclease [Streptomyces misionensis]TWV30474.1 restriction endonuclease [Streptomyces misionensis]